MWRTFYTTDLATCLRTYRRVWVANGLPRLAATATVACGALGAAALLLLFNRNELISGPPAAFSTLPTTSSLPADFQRVSGDTPSFGNRHVSAESGPTGPFSSLDGAVNPRPLPGLPGFLPLSPGPDRPTLPRTVPKQPEQPVPVGEPPSLLVLLLSALLAVLVRRKRW